VQLTSEAVNKLLASRPRLRSANKHEQHDECRYSKKNREKICIIYMTVL
jgi:hypothetical protein